MNIRIALHLPLLMLASFGAVVAQSVTWQQIAEPEILVGSGPVDLRASPNGSLFLRSQFGDVFRSDNLGSVWNHMLPNTVVSGCNILAVSSQGDVYVGTNAGVFRSTDNGEQWTGLGPKIESEWDGVYDILLARDGRIYITFGSGGASWTSDNGKTWNPIAAFVQRYLTSIVEHPDGDLFASVADSGVYRSTDKGATWSLTSLAEGLLPKMVVSDEGTILAGAQQLEGKGVVFRSTDKGNTWSTTTLHDIATSFIALPENVFFVTAANSGVHRSTDGGKTWASVGIGLNDSRMFSITKHPSGRLFCSNFFGNVFRSTTPVTGIAIANAAERFTIHPNPASSVALLALPGNGADTPVSLIDMLGRSLSVELRVIDAASGIVELDLRAVPSGLYMVRGGGVLSGRSLPLVVAH